MKKLKRQFNFNLHKKTALQAVFFIPVIYSAPSVCPRAIA
jgi:hypothetical protein